MSTLADYGFAAEFRDVIVDIIRSEVDIMRPVTRVAEVVAINKESLTADVSFAGDTGSFAARFGLSLQPRKVGNLVRVAGGAGNYYITEILNDTGVHEDYEDTKDAVDQVILDSSGMVFRQPNEPTLDQVGDRGFLVGDIWYDTDDGNHIRRWDGTTWAELDVPLQADLDAAKAEAEAYADAQIAANTATIESDIAAAQAAAEAYADSQIAANTATINSDIAAAQAAAEAYTDSQLATQQANIDAQIANLNVGGGNLLTNSNGDFGPLVGWSTEGSSSSSIDTVGYWNSKSFKIMSAEDGSIPGINRVVNTLLQPNTDYIFSFWASIPAAGGVARVDLVVDGPGITVSEVRQSLTTADGQWHRLVGKFTTGSSPIGTVTLHANSGVATLDLKYFRVGAFQLEAGNTPTAYSPNPQEGVNAQSSADAAQVTANNSILDGNFVANPFFDDWPGGLNSTPTAWSNQAGTPIKDSNAFRTSPYAFRYTVAAGGNAWMVQTIANIGNPDYVTVTLDFYLYSGDPSGAGAMVRWRNNASGYADAWVKLIDEVPNAVTGKWYRVTKTIPRPTTFTGTFQDVQVFVMGGYSPLGTITAKSIVFDTIAVRAASVPEILAYNAASISYLLSRGTDLVTNGTGYLGTNYNFTDSATPTFTPTDAPAGSKGSFVWAKGVYTVTTNEGIPVDPSKRYKLAYWIRETIVGQTSYTYGGLSPIDAYGLSIQPYHYMRRGGTNTTLAAPLNPGDTTVTLTSSANWNNAAGTSTWNRTLIFWDYVDAGGKAWPVDSYSRNVYLDAYADGGISGNVITLRTPWAGPAKPAGTPVANGGSGGSYMYGVINQSVPQAWTNFQQSTSAYTGVHVQPTTAGADGLAATTAFPPGTAQVKLVFLINRAINAGTNPNAQQALGGVSFSDVNAAAAAATTAQASADGKNTISYSTTAGAPSTTGRVNGDLHFVRSGNTVTQQWRLVSGAWAQEQITGAVLTNIDAGSITTGTLGASVTITGPVFQTTATAARGIKIVGTDNGGYGSFITYDNAGNPTLTINGQDGTIAMKGSLSSGSTIAGALLTGPIETTATPSRGVKISNTGLNAYDASGTLKFSIDASTGAVSMVGSLNSGSTITGATINAPLLQTTTTAARGLKIVATDNGAFGSLITYDASGVATLTINGQTGAITMKGSLTSGSDITGATITSGVFQTIATANRGLKVVATDNGGYGSLVTYDASGVATFVVNGQTGSISMKGDLTSGSTITGATLTSGVIQTTSTASRGLKIVAADNGGYGSLVTYDSGGVATLTINGQTGSIAMKGTLSSGSTIAGALITGPLETTSTASRGVKLTNSGIFGYDSVAGSPTLGQVTFSIDSSTGAVTVKGAITTGSTIDGAIITGGTIRTSATNPRVEMSGSTNSFKAYDSSGTATVTIDGATNTITGTLATGNTGTTRVTITGSGVYFYLSPNQYLGGIFASSSGIRVDPGIGTGSWFFKSVGKLIGQVSALDASFNTIVFDPSNGSISVTGDVTADGQPKFTVLADGGANNSATGAKYCRVNSGGTLYASTTAPSSRALKTKIKSLKLDPEQILKMKAKSFYYKEDKKNLRVGFIAEEVHDLGLKELVGYEDHEDPEKPTGFDYDGFGAALLLVCQKQQELINKLEKRVAKLETV